ncbi:hypothetical protein M8C21_010462 [Ambrosia artemisiifolia]|uniref:Membrane-associated kinase regulator 5 n=1 Tax=Ambrosia artemisiifolia TaxID=4212 RepID=A0AAD5CQW3_AMBAR|nr:hypothetical protein M8C21_010462 [Ambrosia artemisiifolia]
MDVFSLLKFWRTSASPDTQIAKEVDLSVDDEDSFFDLVFTKSGYENDCTSVLNDKRRILPLDSPNTKPTQSAQQPLHLLKLSFQNNKLLKPENKTTQMSSSETEEVKISALLKRDNSLRNQLMNEKLLEHDQVSSKRFTKDVINKYLNIMKPSYVKVSKRCTEKSRLSDSYVTPEASPASSVFSPRKDERKSGGRTAFRDVRKHLGKNRSSSAIMQTPARKSDDSVLQQDGIQGAILHCKRSFNSPSQDYYLLRSGSAPVNDQARVSIEQNRSSI